VITDTEIKAKGLRVLSQYLGDIEAERFVASIQRQPFDYTAWRQALDEDLSVDDICRQAMTLRSRRDGA
jgi:hypothetical protein